MILLFDIMGTLVHDPFFEEMPSFFEMDFDAMLEAKHPTAWVEFELGRMDEQEFLDNFFSDRRHYDQDRFTSAVRQAYRWIPGTEAILRDMSHRGYEIHALSNYPVWYQWIEERLQLSRYLRWSFVSCLTEVRKPTRESYLNVVNTLDVDPNECLFIDDRASNCEGAAAVGMSTVLFTDAQTLTRELALRGLV